MNRFRRNTFILAGLAAIACQTAFGGQGTGPQRRADGIPYHYVGRVKLNFLDGTGVVYGYVTAVAGVNRVAPLFSGTPSETTAYLTFRADIKFEALPGNGALAPGQFAATPIMVEPGTWSFYLTESPMHHWDDPDSFSNGEVVATLNRALEQFSVYPTFSINAGAAVLASSARFTLAGKAIDLRELIRSGVVNVTSGPPIPLTGSTPTEPIFAFAGYSLALRSIKEIPGR